MSKTQLGVIFGSRSCEREVSIISAVQLMNHINQEKYDIIPLYISEYGIWYTGQALRDIRTFVGFDPQRKDIEEVTLDIKANSGAVLATRNGKGLFAKPEQVLVARLDVCIVVMHGLHGEDGTLQGLLELANLPYTSTGVAGSAIGMDKIMMKLFFQGAGFPVLPGRWYTASQFASTQQSIFQDVESQLGYPVFVKPANLGSSIGVSRADNRDELHDALELAFAYDRRVLIEKGINNPIELNCSVLGYDQDVTASPIEMPITHHQNDGEQHTFLDFGEKYLGHNSTKGMAGLSRILPAPIDEQTKDRIQDLSKKVFKFLDCKGVVRIDYMYDSTTDSIYITEINTIPGSLAFYLWEAAGIRYSDLIDKMVDYALKAHEDKNARNYSFQSDILKGTLLGAKGAKNSKASKV